MKFKIKNYIDHSISLFQQPHKLTSRLFALGCVVTMILIVLGLIFTKGVLSYMKLPLSVFNYLFNGLSASPYETTCMGRIMPNSYRIEAFDITAQQVLVAFYSVQCLPDGQQPPLNVIGIETYDGLAEVGGGFCGSSQDITPGSFVTYQACWGSEPDGNGYTIISGQVLASRVATVEVLYEDATVRSQTPNKNRYFITSPGLIPRPCKLYAFDGAHNVLVQYDLYRSCTP